MFFNSLLGNCFIFEGYILQDYFNCVFFGFSQKLVLELLLCGGYNWCKGEDDIQQSVSLVLNLDF